MQPATEVTNNGAFTPTPGDELPTSSSAALDWEAKVQAVKEAEHAPALVSPAGPPRAKRRESWVEIPEEFGEGMHFRMWLSYPTGYRAELLGAETTEARKLQILHEVILEHNGWCDEQGQPYPPAESDAFWRVISEELGGVLIALLIDEPSNAPLALVARKRRR